MFIGLIKAMRPKQWVKNVLIFAALVFDRQLTVLPAIIDTVIGAAIFSLVASTIYLINDLSDIEADRQHPEKRKRPIASGLVPAWVAWVAVVGLLLISFPLAYWLSPAFAIVCGVYFILNLAYSLWLKHVVVIDVLLLASFYVLRVVVGVTIIEVERFSPWMYLSITFLALFMGIGKRRAEFVLAQKTGDNHRRVLEFYTREYLDQLIMIVLTIAILAYSLYTFSAPNLPDNHVMMLTIPFVIYGVFRYLYLIQVKGFGEAPEEVLFKDRPFQLTIALWMVSVFVIFYIF
ncbi:MAG: phosphoribose diphosphate--decaprenyl-phosphate phosphoribosyltransferase [Nitrospira bacterium SG8_3]|nr:MAG: phosphoribose diphosphate--decaprenyl-phosphate phosphoribosyltransferase [Nitrospira bacterium SG8_3]